MKNVFTGGMIMKFQTVFLPILIATVLLYSAGCTTYPVSPQTAKGLESELIEIIPEVFGRSAYCGYKGKAYKEDSILDALMLSPHLTEVLRQAIVVKIQNRQVLLPGMIVGKTAQVVGGTAVATGIAMIVVGSSQYSDEAALEGLLVVIGSGVNIGLGVILEGQNTPKVPVDIVGAYNQIISEKIETPKTE